MKALLWLGVAGAVLSGIAHGLAMAGINVESYVGSTNILSIGAVIVVAGALVFTRDLFGTVSRWQLWSIATQSAPSWARVVLLAFFGYWFVSMVSHEFGPYGGGVITESNGTPVVWNHGEVVKELTPEEYERELRGEVQRSSGAWFLVYGAAATVLYSRMVERNAN